MLKHDYNLGGEQSGHIILLDYNPTGDGILTSLMLIQSILEETHSENAGDKRNGFSGLAAAEEMLEPVPISSKPSNKSS